MNLMRTGFVAAAIAAMMILPAAAAQAGEPESLFVVTTLGGSGSQGWWIDGSTHDYSFAPGPAKIGRGSLQFAARTSAADAEKSYLTHELDIDVRDYRAISFGYYLDPASPELVEQYNLNVYVYVDVASATGPSFYDCRYDVVGTNAVPQQWHRVGLTRIQMTTTVAERNGAECGDQISDLHPADTIFRVAVDVGDTSGTDNQIRAAIDNVVVRTVGNRTTYDFEPPATAPAECSGSGQNTITGTGGNDVRNGTAGDDRIDLRNGNDSADGRGGADCLLGGNGNDRLVGGPGADEIRGGLGNDVIDGDAGADLVLGGAGNDQIDAGAGWDTVAAGPGNDAVRADDGQPDTIDCGAGNDTVIADERDDVNLNCERRRV